MAAFKDASTLGSSRKAFSWTDKYLKWRAVGSQSMAINEAANENSSVVQGNTQPRQNLCQGHQAHQEPPNWTTFRMNGYSYPRLSSLKIKKQNYKMRTKLTFFKRTNQWHDFEWSRVEVMEILDG